ncbi:MAG TPA: flagellar basal body P-ring protein FlgI [Stellaceae bacterium]|jgi:flagellar P-ring protein precursor FlgI|nr:flagellar basal body P-ring protein FlgI [Stellaceae bacterium]
MFTPPVSMSKFCHRLSATLFVFCSLIIWAQPSLAASRIKDIADFEGVRDNMLVGYGLVVGLNGTGDTLSQAVFTRESLIGMLERLGVNARDSNLRTANVAAVMVTSTLPAFSRQGARIDVQVSALGNAKSLLGGTLLVTPLLGADGEVYAVAQGTVSSGGFAVKGQGASVTKGVPTAGRIPTGAIVEREVGFQLSQLHSVSLMLHNPDFTTARRVAQVINARMKNNIAQPSDPSTVVLNVPADLKGNIVNLMTDIEQLEIEPDQVARVVIDEQNGIIVMGENVRISTVAVAQGNLTVKVTETPQVSQPNAFAPSGQPTTFNPLNASGVVPNPNPIFNPTQPPASGPFAQTPGNSTLQNQGTIQPYAAPQSNNPALPGPPGNNNVQFTPGGGGSTVVVPRTNIQVDEQSDRRMAVVNSGVTLQELVNNLNALGVGPRDMISILQAIKAAGALQADIEMM